MTLNHELQNEELDGAPNQENSPSVADFIKELEAKEKYLHISPETVIEVEDADFDDMNMPDFIMDELNSGASRSTGSAAAPALSKPDQIAQMEERIKKLNSRIVVLSNEKIDLQEKSRRSTREFDNFKSRNERERGETFSAQLVNMATQILPVLDNLNRAMDFALAMPEEKRNDIQQFFDGIMLVNQQINEIFAGMGVQQIPAVGEKFDPHLHEAVATEENGDLPPNAIAAELLRGYRIGSRVIRHSMVKVVTSPKSSDPGTEPDAEAPLSESDEEAE